LGIHGRLLTDDASFRQHHYHHHHHRPVAGPGATVDSRTNAANVVAVNVSVLGSRAEPDPRRLIIGDVSVPVLGIDFQLGGAECSRLPITAAVSA